MPLPTHEAAAIWNDARDEYMASHPEPYTEAFVCPRCHAQPDETCRRPAYAKLRGSHAPRIDQANKAHWRWHAAAAAYALDVENEAHRAYDHADQ